MRVRGRVLWGWRGTVKPHGPRGRASISAAIVRRIKAAVINRYSQAGRSFTITADQEAAGKREIQNLSETAWTP